MPKVWVKHVKLTPEEMAYDPSPAETAGWTPVPGRGWAAYKRFLERKRGRRGSTRTSGGRFPTTGRSMTRLGRSWSFRR